MQEIDEKWRQVAETIDPFTIRLESSDIHVERLALAWVPMS